MKKILFFDGIWIFYPIFAPAISGEIDLARESAFFALFLSSESGQFAWSEWNNGLMNAFAVVLVYCLHNIKQRSITLSVTFHFMGVQTQLLE